MTSSFTPNKFLEKPGNGDYAGSWNVPVNSDWDAIDTAFGGTTSLSVTGASGSYTLGVSDYRPPNIVITGVLTANVDYKIPAGVGGIWTVYNNTTGSYAVTFSSGGGAGYVTLNQGYRTLAVVDANGASSAISFPLAAAGSSGQFQFNYGGYLAGSSALTTDGTNIGIGTTTPGSKLDVKGVLRLSGSTSGYVGLTAPAAAGSQVYTLPASDGTNGQFLTTSGTGLLSWAGSTAGVSSISGGTTGMSFGAGVGAVTMTGVLAVPNGGLGTAASSLVAGDLFYASSSSTINRLSIGTAGQVLTVSGSSPSWAAAPGGISSITLSGGTTGLLINGATSSTITTSGQTWTISGLTTANHSWTGTNSFQANISTLVSPGSASGYIFYGSTGLYATGHNGTAYLFAGSGASSDVYMPNDLHVVGAIYKAGGTFRIKHPLPALNETHQLVHSFIEGPQADLIYRGRVALVAGKAKVSIDEAATMTNGTFVLLCRDVQCFTTNETGWTAVRGSVSGNILTIEAQDPACTDTISWMVIGERQDEYMMNTSWTDENGKVIVEPLNPTN